MTESADVAREYAGDALSVVIRDAAGIADQAERLEALSARLTVSKNYLIQALRDAGALRCDNRGWYWATEDEARAAIVADVQAKQAGRNR